MIPLETCFTFFLAATLLAIVPGPDNVFVLTQSALHGRGSGVLVVLGLCSGLLLHTAAVAFGVAAVMKASPFAFPLLQMVGAGYLLWLAWNMFRTEPEPFEMTDRPRSTSGALYRRGIIMNVTNPKVSIFFLAFLPQFVDPQWGSISLQMLELGAIFVLSTIIVFGLVAMIGDTLGKTVNRCLRAQQTMNRAAAIVLVALALKLLVLEI